MRPVELGLQLYSVRNQTAVDFPAAVHEVAAIGYRVVELAGYGSLGTAADVRTALDDAGLTAVAGHVGYDDLLGYTEHFLNDAQSLGQSFVVVPSLPERLRTFADGYREAADALNGLGDACRNRGLALCYHHHGYEWTPTATGERGIDILWSATDPALVRAELDVYWLWHAGEAPATYLRAMGGRAAIVHLKDAAPGPDPWFAPVGTGVIDFAPILAAIDDLDPPPHVVVEHDEVYGQPSLDAARTSFENLRRLAET